MNYNIIINGFHGTNEVSANTIIENKIYEFKKRENHWLGQGIYFFEEDPEQAMSWALTQTNDNEKAVVLRTIIEVDSSSFLNLNTRTGIFNFNKLTKEIVKKMEEEELGVSAEQNDPDAKHKLRCWVMDSLPETIKVIKMNFKLDNQPSVLKSIFRERIDIEMASVQICVRDHDVIKKETIEKYSEVVKKPKNNYSVGYRRNRKRKINFKRK